MRWRKRWILDCAHQLHTHSLTQCGIAQQVRSRLALKTKTAGSQALDERGPGQGAVLGEHRLEGAETPGGCLVIQTELQASAALPGEDGPEEREEPAEVVGRQQVQRPTLAPRPYHRALLHPRLLDAGSRWPTRPGAAHPDGQGRGLHILGLHAAERVRDLCNRGGASEAIQLVRREALRTKAEPTELVVS
jgi:hypothetical protein